MYNPQPALVRDFKKVIQKENQRIVVLLHLSPQGTDSYKGLNYAELRDQ